MRSFIFRAALGALCALTLTGCIQSSDPILIDSQPLFGPRLRLSYYTLGKGYAQDPGHVTFAWNGALYTRVRGGMRDVAAFSVYQFEAGDYIVQAVPRRQARVTRYALLHPLAQGVYQVVPIDSEDADEPTRDADCARGRKGACRVMTRAQLFAFARATAARRKDIGGLVLRLPDRAQRHAPHRRRHAPRHRR